MAGLADRVGRPRGAPSQSATASPSGTVGPSGASVRAVVADDSLLLRQGVVAVLRDAAIDVVADAGDVASLLRAVAAHEADVAVVDIRMPPGFTDEGIEAGRQIRTEPTLAPRCCCCRSTWRRTTPWS